MLKTDFTELIGCRVPIQLAGMPGVVTLELAAAVTNAGGLGMISAAHKSPSFLASELDKLNALGNDPVGVNFLMPFLDRECVKVAAKSSRVVEFFYAAPDQSLNEIVHGEGALACWQVGSREEALQAIETGCDLLVAQGTEAGGHVRGNIKLKDLLNQVLGNVDVPVIAAGGIASAKDVAEMLNLGASAVRIGTLFIAAKESGAHPQYIDAVINAGPDATILTETFSVGWPNAHHRVLKSCVGAVNNFQGEYVGERELGGESKPIPRGSIALPTKNTTGEIGAMALYASDSVRVVREARPASQILNDLMEKLDPIIKSRK